MTQNLKLSGRLAVVSGGGGAIGSEVARILSAAGAAIAILEVNPDSAAAIATEITAGGGRARAYICDICSYPAAEKTIQTVAAEMGPVDILVNVAGGSARAQAKRFHEQDMAVVEQVIRLNLFGTLHCIRATVNQMISRNYGKIIFGSSVGLEPALIQRLCRGQRRYLLPDQVPGHGVGRIQHQCELCLPGTGAAQRRDASR